MSEFDRYIGIDWSGAEIERGGVAVARQARCDGEPQLVEDRPRWTRASAVDWLIGELAVGNNNGRTFVGLDFCFGYPAGAALKVFGVKSWPDLTRDIRRRLKEKGTARAAAVSINAQFGGDGPFRLSHDDRKFGFYLREQISRYRVTELFAPGALSVWDVLPGPQVALSTLTGLAALADLIDARDQGRVRFKLFPFEDVAPADNVCSEVYPGLAPRGGFPRGDAGDALRITGWVHKADANGNLLRLPPPMRGPGAEWNAIIREEGWIAGLALA